MKDSYNKEYFKKFIKEKKYKILFTIKILEKIGKLLGKKILGRVLVIGPGLGYEVLGMLYYGIKNKNIYTIDISEFSTKHVRRIIRNVILADVQKLPFKNNTFDFIFAADVLEHICNPLNALYELRRILKPGGLIYVRVPNTFSIQIYKTLPKYIQSIWKFFLGDYSSDDPTHYSELPPYRWEYFFNMTGFKFRKIKIEDIYKRIKKDI